VAPGAALDVATIATSVKLVRAVWAGRAAATGADAGIAATRAGGFSEQVALFGSRVLTRGGRLGVAIARYGAIPAAVYLMFRYPQLINSTLAELGGWLGVDPRVVQFLFWFVALSVIMRLALFMLGPLSRVLRSLGWLTGALAARCRPARARRRPERHLV
jgi:hypothetical protein